jgi:hypothetical protein
MREEGRDEGGGMREEGGGESLVRTILCWSYQPGSLKRDQHPETNFNFQELPTVGSDVLLAHHKT